MRTRCTQFTNIDRLPKQSWFVCANFAGIRYDLVGMDRDNDSTTISRSDYEEKYEFKRRT